MILALVITSGLVIFNSQKLQSNDEPFNPIGYFLVIFSLAASGLSANNLDKSHKTSARSFAYFTMFYNAFFNFTINLCIFGYHTYFYQDDSLKRLMNDSSLLRETIFLSLS